MTPPAAATAPDPADQPEPTPEPDSPTPEPDAEHVVAEVVTEGRPAPSTEPDAPDADPDRPISGELVHLHPQGGTTGLVPVHDELRGMAEIAVTLAMAGVMPKELRRNPANVLAVLLTGRELGVAPMTAVRTFHVIDGQVTVAPKVRMAMVRQQGLGKLWPDADNGEREATWYAERADQPGVTFRSHYRWEQAQMAKLAGPNCQPDAHGQRGDRVPDAQRCTCKDNWRNYPERMLSWRALGYLLDDAFPEVGTGLYSPDELGAVTDPDGEPVFDLDRTDPLVPQAGRAGAPAGPDNTPANPAVVAELGERIKGLPDAAKEALRQLWMAPDDSGQPKLPPLQKLLHRQERIAKALVDSIVKRAKAGEWGDWTPPSATPQPQDGAQGGPDAPAGPDGAADPPEAASGPHSAQEGPDVCGDCGALPGDEHEADCPQRPM